MVAQYLPTKGLLLLVVLVLIFAGATSNSLNKRHVRVKRDKRPIGLPISTPIKTDDAFLGTGGPISSGFLPSSLDESSLTRLQVPGFSRPNLDAFSSVEEDDSLTKLHVPGVSRPSAGAAFSSIDQEDSFTKLQVPGVSRPNSGGFPPITTFDESSLTQLQVPGFSNQNVGGFSFNVDESLAKRQVSSTSRPISVGFYRIDVDDVEVKEIALFATKALSKSQNSILKLNKIILAEAEDVAGKNFKLVLRLENLDEEEVNSFSKSFINCEVVVFDQSWTSTRILRESDCSDTKSIPIASDSTSEVESALDGTNPFTSGLFPPNNLAADASPAKRQIPTTQRPIGGGFSPIDVDNDVKEIAIFAGTAIASKRNSGPARVTKIAKAESQIVAGTNYKLTLELNQPLATEKFLICDALIFDQSWTKTRILSEHRCKVNNNPTSDKPIIVGENSPKNSSSARGSLPIKENDFLPKREVPVAAIDNINKFSSIDVDDPDVKAVAEFAMKVANTAAASSGHSAPVKLVKILKAEWQVVDAVGRNFKLTLELDDGAEESLLCVVSVFEQATWKSNSSWTTLAHTNRVHLFCNSKKFVMHLLASQFLKTHYISCVTLPLCYSILLLCIT